MSALAWGSGEPPASPPLPPSAVTRVLELAALYPLIPDPASIPRDFPAEDRPLMGRGLCGAEELALFLLSNNPSLAAPLALELASIYAAECALEGVDQDLAFAQMCLETGFLTFGGLVDADMHNYCGLGSLDGEKRGERFPDARTGVRAHVQHLKAYGSGEALRGRLVDPRFKYVTRGSAPRASALARKWAADGEYGEKLSSLLRRLLWLTEAVSVCGTQAPRL